MIDLPQPKYNGTKSIEHCLSKRRSKRDFLDEPLTLDQISQLMWAAQGINSPAGTRTAPSAGAIYPLETYLVTGVIDNLVVGFYRYKVNQHQLEYISNTDFRGKLASAALGQQYIATAPASIVLTATYGKIKPRYGDRGIRYANMEAGHAAQNLELAAVALGLGTVAVGAFDDEAVAKLINLPESETPLYILPVGKPM
jgi:SagB-type dehydrogenase family enzyme